MRRDEKTVEAVAVGNSALSLSPQVRISLCAVGTATACCIIMRCLDILTYSMCLLDC